MRKTIKIILTIFACFIMFITYLVNDTINKVVGEKVLLNIENKNNDMLTNSIVKNNPWLETYVTYKNSVIYLLLFIIVCVIVSIIIVKTRRLVSNSKNEEK